MRWIVYPLGSIKDRGRARGHSTVGLKKPLELIAKVPIVTDTTKRPNPEVYLRLQWRRFWRSSGQFATVAPFILIFGLLVGLSLWELRIGDGSRIFLAGENLWVGPEEATLCLLSLCG